MTRWPRVEPADEADEGQGVSVLDRRSTSRATRTPDGAGVRSTWPGSGTIDHHVTAFAAYRHAVGQTSSSVKGSDLGAGIAARRAPRRIAGSR